MTQTEVGEAIAKTMGTRVNETVITEKQARLFTFVANQHQGQDRIGGEPYINHLISYF